MLTEIEVAKKLLQINAIQLKPESPFTWASGLQSPIYCDNRKTLSYSGIRTAIKTSLADKASELWEFDMIAGVATAGIAHGALIAEHLDLPFIYVRSSAKKHGARNQIEGDMMQGKRCLVVEDLISTGGSSIEAVQVLKAAGLEVAGVIAIFTYQLEKASENFASAQCPYATISNYAALLEAGREMEYISESQLATLREWREDPKAWSDNQL
ncbi:MAG: orotate phosphoribosyltransferase [Saprospiraceae bacterium]|jgi:orotate phosphoribosyltransferase